MIKTISIFIVFILIAVGVYYYVQSAAAPVETNIEAVTATPSSAMRAEENMVVVVEQRPGNMVKISQVHLAKPGFVVVHEDNDGTPAEILGSSELLQAGDSSEVNVKLSKAVLNGVKLHAMLHNDIDADGKFNVATDTPVMSAMGGPINGWFDITEDASADAPISI